MGEAIRIYVRRIVGTVDREGANNTAREFAQAQVVDMTRKVMNQAIVDCPVGRTGFLRGQHGQSVSVLKTRVKGTVVNRAKYAAAVHDGSRPHIIRARRKRFLRFEVDGHVLFRIRVRHPGTEGQPWMANALQRVATSEGWTFKPVETPS